MTIPKFDSWGNEEPAEAELDLRVLGSVAVSDGPAGCGGTGGGVSGGPSWCSCLG
ncbi:hypothetical protein GA0115256_143624 [Streptomyces sp. DconLS]|nr:hypothetical protein GA0115256_143624 [Streptomyces sp. DconLS]SCG05644.1 hypothetical protein GA0115258_12876 [Streptomyces sp. LamerLS-31b]